MSTPSEKAPQFIRRPMVLFDDLVANRADAYIWLLCEYVTRWTVNWFNNPEVLLSADEFMHGRRKPNRKDRYDRGLPIESRTTVLRYLALAVKDGYLQERDVGDMWERKAYSLSPWYHPDTCTEYEQVDPQKEQQTPKEQKPVQNMDRTSPSNEQGVHFVYRGSTANVQVVSDGASQETVRRDPIETFLETSSIENRIESLPPVVKNEKKKNEETKGDELIPSKPTEAPETAEQARQRLEETAARTAELTEAKKRHEAKVAERARLEALIIEKKRAYDKLVAEELRLWGLVKKAPSEEKDARENELATFREAMAPFLEEIAGLEHAWRATMEG